MGAVEKPSSGSPREKKARSPVLFAVGADPLSPFVEGATMRHFSSPSAPSLRPGSIRPSKSSPSMSKVIPRAPPYTKPAPPLPHWLSVGKAPTLSQMEHDMKLWAAKKDEVQAAAMFKGRMLEYQRACPVVDMLKQREFNEKAKRLAAEKELQSLKQKMDEMERASAAAFSVSSSRIAELEASNDMLQTRIAVLEPELGVIRSQAAKTEEELCAVTATKVEVEDALTIERALRLEQTRSLEANQIKSEANWSKKEAVWNAERSALEKAWNAERSKLEAHKLRSESNLMAQAAWCDERAAMDATRQEKPSVSESWKRRSSEGTQEQRPGLGSTCRAE